MLAVFNSAAFTTATGVAVGASAAIEVRVESSGALATIYSDEAGTAGITQPGFAADLSGRFAFYAAGVSRGYSVKVTKGTETWTLHNVAIGTAGQLDAGATGTQVMAAATADAAFSAAGGTRLPLNINPNWLLDQINEGALYTVSAGAVQGPDGWTGSATGVGAFKLRTIVDPDNAALRCLEITCTTADVTVDATDNYHIKTAIEGYDVAGLQAGTASASQITAQFKLKSNVTGTFGIAIQNSAANRRYIGTITIPNTSENSYSISLMLDTSGTWLYTNGAGLVLILTLAAGANFQSTAGAWGLGAEQTTSAQANFMSAITNVMYLKRFHIIPGGVALAYHAQDIYRELAKAQRYYEKTWGMGVAVGTADSLGMAAYVQMTAATATAVLVDWQYKVTKRATPTLGSYSDVTGVVGKVRDRQSAADVNVNNYITSATHAALYGVLAANIGPITSAHLAANSRLL